VAVTSISAHAIAGEVSDLSLLRGVQHGDELAFEQLFARHYGWVFGVVLRITADAEEAEEIVQDTFLRLYQRPISADNDVNVRGWLYRVAANTSFNAVRSRNRRAGWMRRLAGRASVQEAGDDPLSIVTATDEAAQVRKCLAQLPERQRNVLLLRATGHSYAEVAEMIGVNPTSVGSILARAEKALRTTYEREFSGHGDRK
jgi:RNA polymerase sigma-70 factor, ECF subfamily